MPRKGGLPRGLAQRLGLAASDRGATLDTGTRREPEILSAWIERLERGEWTHESEREIDPATVVWAGALPASYIEHFDGLSPLLVHPDAYAYTWDGELVTIDVKCARYGIQRAAWWNGAHECPWYYAVQLQAYHGVLQSRRGLLVVGGGWNRDPDDPRGDGPLLALPSDADEDAIAEVREVAWRAWALPGVGRARPWLIRV